MNDDPLPWKIAFLRGQIAELGAAIHQLRQAGLDNVAAELLISRKRAELECLINLARQSPSTGNGPKPETITSR
jgi:hypothetical protein